MRSGHRRHARAVAGVVVPIAIGLFLVMPVPVAAWPAVFPGAAPATPVRRDV